MQYSRAKRCFHLLCCQWCGQLTGALRRCNVEEKGRLDSVRTTTIFGTIFGVLARTDLLSW